MRRSPSQMAPLSVSKRNSLRKSVSDGYLKFKFAPSSKWSIQLNLDIFATRTQAPEKFRTEIKISSFD
jgi:hypothetical protein